MPDRVPSLWLPISDGIMALVNTVASSAPMVARPKEISTSGASPISPGIANQSPHSPTKSSTVKAAIHGFLRAPAPAADCPAASCCCSGRAIDIEHDEMIGQLVLVEMARRKMLGEDLAAHLDGLDETLGARAAREMTGQLRDHVLPYRGLHFAIDALIGDHLGVMLGERDIDEHAGAAFGGVQVLRQELLDGALMRGEVLPRPRQQREAQRRPLKENVGDEEHGKLKQVDVFDRPIREEDQRDGNGEGEQSSPQNDEGAIAVGSTSRHHHDLATRLRFGARYGAGDGGAFLGGEGYHRFVLPAPRSSAAAEVSAAAGEAPAEIAASAAPASSSATPAVPAGTWDENRSAATPSPDLLRAPRQVPDEPRDDEQPEDHHEPIDGRLVGVEQGPGFGPLLVSR